MGGTPAPSAPGRPPGGTPRPSTRRRLATLPPAQHDRDRLTLSLYTYFIAWGWLLYSFSPAIPLIAAEQRISGAQAGLHGTAMAVGTVTSSFVSARLVARTGRRAALLIAGAVLAAGVVVLVTGPSIAVTLTGALVTALGGTLAISAAQPALAVHHGEASGSAVSEANGVGALFGLVAPLALGGSVAAGWGWRPAVAATVGFVVVASVLVTLLPGRGALGHPAASGPAPTGPAADDASPAPDAVAGAPPPGARGFSRAYWLFWSALIAAVAIENATTFWVADLVAERTGAGPGIATAALAGLVGAMAVMRFAVGALLNRWPVEAVLVAAFAVAAAGWLVTWTATSTGVALGGLVLAGLGYGAQYPLTIALVLRSSGGRPDQAQASSSLGVGLAIGGAPFLLGALADGLGTRTAFVLVPVLTALGAAAVLLGRRAERRS
ncbi:sugar MFS transporter [uncultured Cellulomonas sp.]|uniref:MFS transporter n=1 Tax=uncultured Cellulomonas sp. TaxID=189682 RepID=UPI00262EC7BC|nr:MFS transporter [uncultured Cellulomonas sp.]